jgi:phage shock protein E
MKKYFSIGTLFLLLAQGGIAQQIPNRLISYPVFLDNVRQANAVGESRRLTEQQFLQAMSEPGVVLLDARSASKFNLRHLKGAVNLSLPDFTAEELEKIIPIKNTKVLIYCNNNFLGSPVSFPSKAPGASLNISTFVNLTTYGYTNVYELGPLVNVKSTTLPFEGTETVK